MRLKDQNGAEYCLGPVSIGNSSNNYEHDKIIGVYKPLIEYRDLHVHVHLASSG
jgi:hypothetical protein